MEPEFGGKIYGLSYQYNDSYGQWSSKEKRSLHIFEEPGLKHVEMTGYADGCNLEGRLDIKIPPPASKVEIRGFRFSEELNEWPIRDTIYQVKIRAYCDSLYEDQYFERSFVTSELSLGDSVIFDEPVNLYQPKFAKYVFLQT